MKEENWLQISIKDKGLYALYMKRIHELKQKYGENVISFKIVNQKLSIKKEYIWELYSLLNELGFIEIVPCHGIRVLYKIV